MSATATGSEIWVQPSELPDSIGALSAAAWLRGIPTPGSAFASPVFPGVSGAASCANLLGLSAPGPLEAWDIFSYSIGYGLVVHKAAGLATAPTLSIELAFLLNGVVRYLTMQSQLAIDITGTTDWWQITGAFVSDLNNPIRVAGQSNLALRLGLSSSIGVDSGVAIIGAQYSATAPTSVIDFPSTLSYSWVDLTQN